jgi:EAL domain-containing protein (putative c-di-GMP-specific phosphodiesterase class I)
MHCWSNAKPDSPSRAVLLLGPRDGDIAATLQAVLQAGGISYTSIGPLVVIPDAGSMSQQLTALFRAELSAYAQGQIRAAYTSADTRSTKQVTEALLYAEPLPALLDQLPYIWAYEALTQDALFSVFQPILSAGTAAAFGYEALIRARLPQTSQIVGAGPLIQACDALGLHHQLDQFARRTAIRCAATQKLQDARLFINFMPGTIYNPELCLRTTIAAANEYSFPLNQLVFEVVETEQINDMKHLRRILDYYRAQGMGTAVDDMGAGFTTLQYLTELQPDYVKLDRDLVAHAARDKEAADNLTSMIAAAKEMNIQVIAEGIETEAQKQICVQAGADYLQGFLFGYPAEIISRPGEAFLPSR